MSIVKAASPFRLYDDISCNQDVVFHAALGLLYIFNAPCTFYTVRNRRTSSMIIVDLAGASDDASQFSGYQI